MDNVTIWWQLSMLKLWHNCFYTQLKCCMKSAVHCTMLKPLFVYTFAVCIRISLKCQSQGDDFFECFSLSLSLSLIVFPTTNDSIMSPCVSCCPAYSMPRTHAALHCTGWKDNQKNNIKQIPLQRFPREIQTFTTTGTTRASGATISQKIVALNYFVGHDKSIPSTPSIQVNCSAVQLHRNDFQSH